MCGYYKDREDQENFSCIHSWEVTQHFQSYERRLYNAEHGSGDDQAQSTDEGVVERAKELSFICTFFTDSFSPYPSYEEEESPARRLRGGPKR